MAGSAPLSPRGTLAVEYAKLGWKIFPITQGTKDAPRIKWGVGASNDVEQVRRWWTTWPEDNIGLACGASGLAVVDLDDKKGKEGSREWAGLQLEFGPCGETRASRTPSGGTHLFFLGDARTCQKFSQCDGIDIRGTSGYVLLPGSTYRPSPDALAGGEVGGEYAWVDEEHSIIPVPRWVTTASGDTTPRKHEPIPVVELDQPHAIEWARRYLEADSREAIAGAQGNLTTYVVACSCRGQGLSESKTLELMAEFYNPRCLPAWDSAKLEGLVKNAYTYSRNGPPGGETAEYDFRDAAEDISYLISSVASSGVLSSRFLTLDELLDMPPPEWLISELIPLGSVGILYGASQSFKSFFAFHLAACCATNREAFPGKVTREADAFYVLAEGAHGFRLRAQAWIKHHRAKPDQLFVLSGSVYLDHPGEAEKLAADIVSRSEPGKRRFVVIDTLSANFTGKENTDEVAGFLRRCLELSRCAEATVLVVHHTGKDGQKEERGHYSIRANVDFSLRMDRKKNEPRTVVEVMKFKDFPAGKKLSLRAVSVEVTPDIEFSTSLILEEEPAAARCFADDADQGLIELLRMHDGKSLKSAAEAVRKERGVSLSTAKAEIKRIVETCDEVRLDRVSPSNPQSGLVLRFSANIPFDSASSSRD